MSQKVFASITIRLAITAIFTSLVCVATMVFSIYVPHTKGFFNIGETMVYTTALLFGPLIGAFAGGVGSMFADIFLGYSHYAPATLLIKACEGGIVGILGHKRLRFSSKIQWKAFTFVAGLIAGILLGSIGSLYYSGSVELYLGIPPPGNPNLILFVPPEFWYSLGALVILLITLMGFIFESEFGWLVLTILVGGLVMVTGYFLYEQFFLGVAAIAEIPVNIGQMTVGLIVSIPIVRAVWRSLPSLRL
ncbi:MAG: hypothetical protein AOA66_1098 [Candidatus Bathyarchaeota archaeon BA2]|nr:MAG: hypothetical protein AOA66_1098 [Candidatus Bathyarchaeota archaeon BA2]